MISPTGRRTLGGSFCLSIGFAPLNQTSRPTENTAARGDPLQLDFVLSGLAVSLVFWYSCTMVDNDKRVIVVERVQTGVRIEKRLLKVLKGLAELKDMTLGDLLEGIVLHSFEGKAPFSAETQKDIEKLRVIYGLTLKASDSHQLKERHK